MPGNFFLFLQKVKESQGTFFIMLINYHEISSHKSQDYQFVLQVKLLAKCCKWSGKVVSRSAKSQGTFFSDLWLKPWKHMCYLPPPHPIHHISDTAIDIPYTTISSSTVSSALIVCRCLFLHKEKQILFFQYATKWRKEIFHMVVFKQCRDEYVFVFFGFISIVILRCIIFL